MNRADRRKATREPVVRALAGRLAKDPGLPVADCVETAVAVLLAAGARGPMPLPEDPRLAAAVLRYDRGATAMRPLDQATVDRAIDAAQGLCPFDQTVYQTIASYAFSESIAWPAQLTVADDIGGAMTSRERDTLRRRVSRSVDRLERAGWLSKSARLRGRHGWTFLIYELLHAWDLVAESVRARIVRRAESLRDPAQERAGIPAAATRNVSVPLIPDSPRDAGGCAIQACARPGCGAFPVDPITNATMPVPERRWWCAAHRHLAAPGDLEPWTSRLAYGPGGAIVDLDEIEREAADQAHEAKRRADELAQRRAQRRAQWPALEAENNATARILLGDNLKGARA